MGDPGYAAISDRSRNGYSCNAMALLILPFPSSRWPLKGALALLLKAGIKPAATMMPAAFAIILMESGRDAMEKAE
jgi:hypothetical protein